MLTVKFQDCEWYGEHLRAALEDALRPQSYAVIRVGGVLEYM